MKKIIGLIVGLPLLLLLISCSAPLTCTTDETLKDGECVQNRPVIHVLEDVSYASDVSYSQFVGNENEIEEDKWFVATFTDVDITPVNNQVCFEFNILDAEYRGFTYFAMMVKTKDSSTVATQTFELETVNSDISSCFAGVDSSDEYMVLIGKLKESGDGVLEAVAGFRFTITNYDSRLLIKDVSVAYEVNTILSTNSQLLTVDLAIPDELKKITELKVVVIENSGNSVISELIIPIDETNRDGNDIVISEIDSDAYSPGVGYTLQVYAKGNDGVDDYEDVSIYKETFLTNKLSFMDVSLHNLFAFVKNMELQEDGLHLDIYMKNTGYFINTVTGEDFIVEFNIYSSGGIQKSTTLLLEGMNQFVIPYDQIDAGDIIKVELQDTTSTLVVVPLDETMPTVTDLVLNTDNKIEFNLSKFILEPSNLEIKLITKNTREVIEFQSDFLFSLTGLNSYNIQTDLTGHSSIIVQFIYTYKGYDDITEYIYEEEIDLDEYS